MMKIVTREKKLTLIIISFCNDKSVSIHQEDIKIISISTK